MCVEWAVCVRVCVCVCVCVGSVCTLCVLVGHHTNEGGCESSSELVHTQQGAAIGQRSVT